MERPFERSLNGWQTEKLATIPACNRLERCSRRASSAFPGSGVRLPPSRPTENTHRDPICSRCLRRHAGAFKRLAAAITGYDDDAAYLWAMPMLPEAGRSRSPRLVRLRRAATLSLNKAPAGLAVARHSSDPQEGCDADGNGADNRECDLPPLGRHEVFRDAMRGMMAGNNDRRDEDKGNRELRPERANGSEQELASAESKSRGQHADENGAKPTCARIDGQASVKSNRQRKPIATMHRRMPRMIMVVSPIGKL